MKFAKELEEDLVPEWRAKYLNYKVGKKRLKAVSRALRGVNVTPGTLKSRPTDVPPPSSLNNIGFVSAHQERIPPHSILVNHNVSRQNARGPSEPLLGAAGAPNRVEGGTGNSRKHRTPAMTIPHPHGDPDARSDHNQDSLSPRGIPNYGSMVPSPPASMPPAAPSELELPDPALDPGDGTHSSKASQPTHKTHNPHQRSDARRASNAAESSQNAYKVGRTHAPSYSGTITSPKKRGFFPRRTLSTPDTSKPRPLIQRLLTHRGRLPKTASKLGVNDEDVRLEAYREFDMRQAQFFAWMDKELEKVESFYRSKEDEATDRLEVLKAQLHEMRDRRLEEIIISQRAKEKLKHQGEERAILDHEDGRDQPPEEDHGARWPKQIETMWDAVKAKPGTRFGKPTGTGAANDLGSPGKLAQEIIQDPQQPDSRRDFVRRHYPDDAVPYRQAKRKLKVALSEFYRGLELLKSYALLNRTAFRKINKKYDKAVQARPTGRYLSEKVNTAWFVQSGLLDGHIQAVEDLYARYFERGNHKVAVGKLRSKNRKPGEHYASVYRNGLLVGAGIVFGIQGVIYGAELLSDPSPTLRVQTSFLLQIYAGYFLGLLLFLLFCLDCRIWTQAKINYVFIFEFDTRHHLDWRQLSELPCFFVFLEGVFMWLNFQRIGSEALYIYYPVMLVGLTLIILCFPARILYHRSRMWWLYSNWRLLLAGIYPVEFRDFFLGDQYCSQTYSMGNIELFFCLYAQHWSDPPLCNSSHSRLLGFFSTLPGIWRALQCLRRYYDTRNIFPHLVNGGKYTFTILYYMSLSLYRLDKTPQLKALFIFCATVNALYCSIWDLAMDWSLGNPYARYPFLREVLGYKRPSFYYIAMVLDPILRFNWIFYAIYSNDLQHSAALSFFIGLSEVFRRGLWSLFRVENEHCTNVGRFRASRDVPLPYEIASPSTSSIETTTAEDNPSSSPAQEAQDQAYKPPRQPQRRATMGGVSPGPDRASANADTDLERATTHRTTTSSAHPSATSGGGDGGDTSFRRRLNRAATTSATREPLSPAPAPQRGIARVGTLMAQAHAQDFERRRKPAGAVAGASGNGKNRSGSTSAAGTTVPGHHHQQQDDDDDEVEGASSDDDDDDDEDVEEEALIRFDDETSAGVPGRSGSTTGGGGGSGNASGREVADAERLLERHRSLA